MGSHTRARRRRRRTTYFGAFVTLISTTSAVSLNDFQAVQDGVLPVACSLVYHAAIEGCTTADFSSRLSCSLSCVAGLGQTEDETQDQCAMVDTDSRALSLLYAAQRGSLILNLCVGNGFTLTPSSSTTIRTTATVPSLTTTRTIGSFSLIPSATPPAVETSTLPIPSTATATTFTTVPPPTTSIAQPTSQLTTSQLTSQLTTLPPSETSETSSLLSTSTTSTANSATSTSSDDNSGRGAGSPFDTVSSASKVLMAWSLLLPLGAALVGLGLLYP